MKKRYKLLIGFAIFSVVVLFLYFITKDNKIYYLSLGDSLAVGINEKDKVGKSYNSYLKEYLEDRNKLEIYIDEYVQTGYRTIDVLNDIKENKEVKINNRTITLKNALVKADIITLSIGTNDLFYKLRFTNNSPNADDLYTYVDEVLVDIEKLFKAIRKTTKEEVYMLGFYNPFMNCSEDVSNNLMPIIEYANSKLENIAAKYRINIINVQDSFRENKDVLASYCEIHPTDTGYKVIAREIIAQLNKKILAK